MLNKSLEVITKAEAKANALNATWTFPLVLFSAFIIGWAAEAAQFLMSQGLALALLAWLQTLPEYAVEVKLAWDAGQSPANLIYVTANFTGSIRLLAGLGIPMVYFIWAIFRKRNKDEKRFITMHLDKEHSVEIVGLFAPLPYFFYIWMKGTLNIYDAGVLLLIYLIYVSILIKLPPQETEKISELPFVPRKIMQYPSKIFQLFAILFLFLIGGVILYIVVHPFVESMKGMAVLFGISAFYVIQWVAPFLSEFPEKVTAFNWARYRQKAPMAMMNIISSNINQWTVLVMAIPIVYAISSGGNNSVVFCDAQKTEIGLTIMQSLLCIVMFINLKFSWHEALAILLLWSVQMFVPSSRLVIERIYIAWIIIELVRLSVFKKELYAIKEFKIIISNIIHKRPPLSGN